MDELVEKAAKRLRFQGSTLSPEEQEETWGKLKDGTKNYWRNFVKEVMAVIEEE